jgi:hypothetical protein
LADAATIPYYGLGMHRLPEKCLFGDDASSPYFCGDKVGMALWNVSLAVWYLYYSVIPLAFVWLLALSGLVKRRTFLAFSSLLVTVVMYLHLVAGLYWKGWPNNDVRWVFEVVNHL